ncbi:MAG TPA: hypothetical protein EYF94_01640, partial [Porticoccaceae bacterium]|nr:hypothetical protein [Porticoccaceae bacterium]
LETITAPTSKDRDRASGRERNRDRGDRNKDRGDRKEHRGQRTENRDSRAEPRRERSEQPKRKAKAKDADANRDGVPMVTYRLEVGNNDGISPSNIVGAIANEADIESRFIGEIKLHDDYSTVDLPEGMPANLLNHLKKVRVCAKPMRISVLGGSSSDSARPYTEKVASPRQRKITDSDDKKTLSRNVENKRTAEPKKPAKKVFTGSKKTFEKGAKSKRSDRSDRSAPSTDGSAPLKKKKTYTKKPKRS